MDQREVLIALATLLYKEGKLALKQAADFAELSVENFPLKLGRRVICV